MMSKTTRIGIMLSYVMGMMYMITFISIGINDPVVPWYSVIILVLMEVWLFFELNKMLKLKAKNKWFAGIFALFFAGIFSGILIMVGKYQPAIAIGPRANPAFMSSYNTPPIELSENEINNEINFINNEQNDILYKIANPTLENMEKFRAKFIMPEQIELILEKPKLAYHDKINNITPLLDRGKRYLFYLDDVIGESAIKYSFSKLNIHLGKTSRDLYTKTLENSNFASKISGYVGENLIKNSNDIVWFKFTDKNDWKETIEKHKFEIIYLLWFFNKQNLYFIFANQQSLVEKYPNLIPANFFQGNIKKFEASTMFENPFIIQYVEIFRDEKKEKELIDQLKLFNKALKNRDKDLLDKIKKIDIDLDLIGSDIKSIA